MTPAQNAAFQAGSGVTPGTLLTSIASVVLVLVFARLPRLVRRSGVAQRFRDLVIAGALGVAMALLVLASAAVDLDRQASSYYLAEAAPEAKGRNVVNVILVDFRALDTLGEIAVVLRSLLIDRIRALPMPI